MPTKQTDMSWPLIAFIWLVAIPLTLVSIRFLTNRRHVSKETTPSVATDHEQDPVGLAAFQAGYEFGARCKATGLAKLSERELDGYALQVLEKVDVPDEKRGLFIMRFKRGFAWGW